MIVLLAIVGEQDSRYSPPPLSALPFVIVKPSMRQAAVAPAGAVTTEPAWLPSRIVSWAAKLRVARSKELGSSVPAS
jgi:hypothetical protein